MKQNDNTEIIKYDLKSKKVMYYNVKTSLCNLRLKTTN